MVLVGALPRILVAGDALPSWLRPFIWSDVLLTWARGLSGGRLPYWNSYFEYPPLVGYLSGLLSWAAPTAFAYVAMWAVVQAAAAAMVAVVLLRAGAGARVVWAWALAPQLVLLAPMNFDVLAILALVAAVLWARANAPARAAAALAVGTVAKIFPAAALPIVLLRGARPRRMLASIGTFVLLVAACYAPAAGAPYSSLESLGRYSVGIAANFDSLWGFVASALDAAGLPASTIVLAVTTLGLVSTYVAFVLPMSRSRDPAVPIALAVLTVLLWSRLYSPQFSLWALPLFALLAIPRSVFVLLTVADIAVFLTVYPLTLVDRPANDPAASLLLALLGAAVIARHAALALAWLSVRRGPPPRAPRT